MVAAAVVIYGLWTRRITFRCRFERAVTSVLVLQAFAVLLLLPGSARYYGHILYRLSGHKHVGSLMGCCLCIIAMGILRYSVACRVAVGDELRRQAARVSVSITLSIPTVIGAFWASSAPMRRFRPNIFEITPDFWLGVFWLVAEATLIWLLGSIIHLLWVARADPRAKQYPWIQKVNNLYITGCVFGIMAATTRIVTVLIPPLQPIEGSSLMWIFGCASGSLIASAATKSWKHKQLWFEPQGVTRGPNRADAREV